MGHVDPIFELPILTLVVDGIKRLAAVTPPVHCFIYVIIASIFSIAKYGFYKVISIVCFDQFCLFLAHKDSANEYHGSPSPI